MWQMRTAGKMRPTRAAFFNSRAAGAAHSANNTAPLIFWRLMCTMEGAVIAALVAVVIVLAYLGCRQWKKDHYAPMPMSGGAALERQMHHQKQLQTWQQIWQQWWPLSWGNTIGGLSSGQLAFVGNQCGDSKSFEEYNNCANNIMFNGIAYRYFADTGKILAPGQMPPSKYVTRYENAVARSECKTATNAAKCYADKVVGVVDLSNSDPDNLMGAQ
jgi:hypothetical protein